MAQLHNLPDPVLWVFPVVVWQSFLQWQAGRLPLNHWGSLSTIQVLLGRFPLLPHTTSRWHGWNIVLYFLPSTSVNNVHSNKILLSYQAYLLSDLWLEVSCIIPAVTSCFSQICPSVALHLSWGVRNLQGMWRLNLLLISGCRSTLSIDSTC